MPRAPAPAPAPRPAAAPPAPASVSVYEEAWAVVTTVDPSFQPPADDEDENSFLTRLTQAVEVLPEATYNTCSNELDAWYNVAAGNIANGQMVTPPPGYGNDEPEAAPPAAAAAPVPAAAKPVHKGAEALKAYNEKKRQEKLAAQAGNGQTPVPGAAPPAPPRRGAAPPAAPTAPGRAPRAGTAAAPPAPGRPPAPAPVPAAPVAAAPPVERGVSTVGLIRDYMITYPAATAEDMVNMLKYYNAEAKASTIAGTMTSVRGTIEAIKKAGGTVPNW